MRSSRRRGRMMWCAKRQHGMCGDLLNGLGFPWFRVGVVKESRNFSCVCCCEGVVSTEE
jgi:hypothetical protein